MNVNEIQTKPHKKDILKDETLGAQEVLKLTQQDKQALSEKLNNNVYINNTNKFIDKIFKKNSTIGNILKKISSWAFNAFGIEHDDVSWEDFVKGMKGELKGTDSGNIEEFVVAHRSLGYKGGENSAEAVNAAIKGGEKQIEFDVRSFNGNLYAAHDKLDKKSVKKAQPLDKMLETFANAKNQDVSLFVDLKDQSSISPLIKEMAKIDADHKNDKNYIPLLNRSFFTSFDPAQLQTVYNAARRELKLDNQNETSTRPPLMFHYYPTANIPGGRKILKTIGKDNIKSVLGLLDKATDSKLNLAKNSKDTNIKLFPSRDDKITKESSDKSSVYITDIIPPAKIVAMIKNSNGYLSIPYKLASKELIKKIKITTGCKVALFGVENDRETQESLSFGADLIISDKPNIIN